MKDAGVPDTIETLDFTMDAGLGARATIGLVVLQSDQTIEFEFARLVRGEGVAVYHARIPNAMEVTPDTLRQMERDLPKTVALLPEAYGFDAIGYGCTSGATMIGEERVDKVIRRYHPSAKTSNPISACKAAFTALGVNRIALVTPYAPSVTLEMQNNLVKSGFDITAVASFNQSSDLIVARITAESILQAVLKIGARNDCDGVFVSCTSLRALEIIADAEAALGKPVVSSNQALAWHLMRLSGLTDAAVGAGKLFDLTQP